MATPLRVVELKIRNEFIDKYGHVTYIGFNILWERQRDAYIRARGVGLDVLINQ